MSLSVLRPETVFCIPIKAREMNGIKGNNLFGGWSGLSRLEMETHSQSNESRASRTHGSSCTTPGVEGAACTYSDLRKKETSGHHRRAG